MNTTIQSLVDARDRDVFARRPDWHQFVRMRIPGEHVEQERDWLFVQRGSDGQITRMSLATPVGNWDPESVESGATAGVHTLVTGVGAFSLGRAIPIIRNAFDLGTYPRGVCGVCTEEGELIGHVRAAADDQVVEFRFCHVCASWIDHADTKKTQLNLLKLVGRMRLERARMHREYEERGISI